MRTVIAAISAAAVVAGGGVAPRKALSGGWRVVIALMAVLTLLSACGHTTTSTTPDFDPIPSRIRTMRIAILPSHVSEELTEPWLSAPPLLREYHLRYSAH